MHRTMPCVCVLVLLSFTISGCSRTPTEELDQVQETLDRVRDSEGYRYAPEGLYEAEVALEAAQLEIDTQAKKFALTRSYEEANRLLADAKSAAESAEQAALAGREQARLDATEALAVAEKALSEAKAAVQQTRGSKGTQDNIAEIRTELERAASSLDEANADFEAGDYVAARAHADAIRARTMSILADIAKAQKKAT